MLIAVAAVAVLALGGLGYYLFQRSQQGQGGASQQEASSTAAPAGGGANAGKVPDPVFLVLDKQAVVRFSKAGQDIARQMQPFVQKTQESLAGQRAALERQAAQLQANTSLSPAEREKQERQMLTA